MFKVEVKTLNIELWARDACAACGLAGVLCRHLDVIDNVGHLGAG